MRLMHVMWNRAALAVVIAVVSVGCGQSASGRATSDAPLARWQLAEEPRPKEKTLSLLVQELECATGQSAEGRIVTPEVEYREDAAVVTIRVDRRSDSEDCPSKPDTPYALELEEPVGARTLLDGNRTPPARPEPDNR